uniref:Endonuclease domain-containing 1 protein n=1 Tax=Athene cunicularia TaxID=194338 RepID=A0A663LZR7_ATHCN
SSHPVHLQGLLKTHNLQRGYLCIGLKKGQIYDFSPIHVFSYTEMTKNGCSSLTDFCSRETCSLTPIPNTNTFSSSLLVKLMGPIYPKTMEREYTLLNHFSVSLEQLSRSQAILQDYKNLTGLNRGHLNPSSHHSDPNSRTATFTLTNIVPQDEKLNGGAWNNYEQQTMIRSTKGCNTTYVIVGAVPGNNYIAKGRVNKPSHIWSSACCEVDTNHRKTWAVIAENDKNMVQLLTLGELEDVLTHLYGRDQVSLFDSSCPR